MGNHDSGQFLDGRSRSMLRSTNMDFFISNISELRGRNGMVSRALISSRATSRVGGSNAPKDSRPESMRNQDELIAGIT